MKRILTSLAAAAALSSLSTSALAQGKDFATQGTFAFGVERAFGVYIGKRKWETECLPPGAPGPNGCEELTHDYTRVSLLVSGPGDDDLGFSGAPNPYLSPRVGFDYFVIDGLSLGGSLGFWSYSEEREIQDKTDGSIPQGSIEDFDHTGFLFSPRVGYAIMFSDVFGIWPRGGLTFWTDSRDDNRDNFGDTDSNEFALTLEFQLVFVPLEHVGITVGPVLDFGFAGEIDQPGPGPDPDMHTTNFGIFVAGMFGYI
jgi:hypothetical protein